MRRFPNFHKTYKKIAFEKGLTKKKKNENKLRRQWKPLPTLIKEKEPLWYRVP